MSKKAIIVLEDGFYLEGTSFGAQGQTTGELVFNTSMTGYQEILTDPSYKGQIVMMTYPLIGNYGVNPEDVESRRVWVEGFVVKECSRVFSNWRATDSLDNYLNANTIVGIEGVDTRALTKHIRSVGAMRAIISTEEFDPAVLAKKAAASPDLVGRDLVKEVTCDKVFEWNDTGAFHVVAIDCGIKYTILRQLAGRDCRLTVVPASTTAEAILALAPDGIFLSNGPGDPAAVTYVVETVKALMGKVPIFGICLGHQMLGLALGGETFKLKFGHHGANHPVQDTATGKVVITSQNHGFCVAAEALPEEDIEITHMNLNDQTLEGLRHKQWPLFSVQFHPEAAPGPHDAAYLFDQFISLIQEYK